MWSQRPIQKIPEAKSKEQLEATTKIEHHKLKKS